MIGFLIGAKAQLAGFQCTIILGGEAYFNLFPMQAENDYIYHFRQNSTQMIMYFNFCKMIQNTCKHQDSFAAIYDEDNKINANETCFRTTSDKLFTGYHIELLDHDQPQKGLSIQFQGGDIYKDDEGFSKTFQTTFNIFCAKDQSQVLLRDIIIDQNQYIMNIQSTHGCPTLELTEMWKMIESNQNVFSVLMLVAGIFQCFFGLEILIPTLFFGGYMSGFGLVLAVVGGGLINNQSSILLVWSMLLFGIVFGAGVGYLAMSIPKYGFFSLGVWLGVILAFLLNNAFLYRFPTNPPELMLYLAMGVLGIIFGLISCCLWKKIVVISTSIIGAYLMSRGVSIQLGGFPNELDLTKRIQYKELTHVPTAFYGYFGAIFVLSCLGYCFQESRKKARDKYYSSTEDRLLGDQDNDMEMDMSEIKDTKKTKLNSKQKQQKKPFQQELQSFNHSDGKSDGDNSDESQDFQQMMKQMQKKQQIDQPDESGSEQQSENESVSNRSSISVKQTKTKNNKYL